MSMSELITPYPYQLTGADWLAEHPQALLADDMGLGKSAQAIRGADLVGARTILVLCPAAVRINWAREFQRFSPMDRPCTVILTGKDHIPPGPGVVVCSYDLAVPLAQRLKLHDWDLLVLDEAHYLKERSTKRTKAVYGRSSGAPGIAGRAKRVWRLTGTPAPNDASELYTHLMAMGTIKEPYWDFVFRFCTGFQNDFGYKVTGHKNVEHLKALLAPVMLRRRKMDVLKELPPIHYQEVTVEPAHVQTEALALAGQLRSAPALAEEIRVGERTLAAALAAVGGPAADDALGVLAGMAQSLTTLRRYIGMAKVPSICALLAEELEANPGEKVVLFAVHQAVVEEATRRLAQFHPVAVYGKTGPNERQRNIDAFQEDPKCRVFVGNVVAAGTGITLTAAAEVCFLEQSWVPSENAQSAARCHRIGQWQPVRVRVFSLAGSVDEQVQQTLLRKARELTKIF